MEHYELFQCQLEAEIELASSFTPEDRQFYREEVYLYEVLQLILEERVDELPETHEYA